MRYIIALVCVFVFSSFTLCSRWLVKDSNSWTIFIYPDCSDTTTYIQHEYYRFRPSNVRSKKKGWKWEVSPDRGTVEEHFCMNGNIISESWLHQELNDTIYSESVYYGDKHRVYDYFKHPILHKSISISDSEEITLCYFKDGTIQNCVLEKIKGTHNGYESIEWDQMHKEYWAGKMMSVSLGIVDSIEEEGQYGLLTTKIISGDSLKKIGKWKKYDSQGMVVDSAYFSSYKSNR